MCERIALGWTLVSRNFQNFSSKYNEFCSHLQTVDALRWVFGREYRTTPLKQLSAACSRIRPILSLFDIKSLKVVLTVEMKLFSFTQIGFSMEHCDSGNLLTVQNGCPVHARRGNSSVWTNFALSSCALKQLLCRKCCTIQNKGHVYHIIIVTAVR